MLALEGNLMYLYQYYHHMYSKGRAVADYSMAYDSAYTIHNSRTEICVIYEQVCT